MLKWLFERSSQIALAVLTASLIIACNVSSSDRLATPSNSSSSNSSQNCRTIEHDFGITEICGKPEKIVALDSNTIDLLLSLDTEPTGVALRFNPHTGEFFDNPAEQIPYVGDRLENQPANLGSHTAPSLEKLAAMSPDLILGGGSSTASIYELLSQIAPTILWKSRTADGQWQENLRDIAQALGEPEKAEVAFDRYDALIAEARKDFADFTDAHPKLLLLGTGGLEGNIAVILPQSYLGRLMEKLGFEVISQPMRNDLPSLPISIEALSKFDEADAIIVLNYNTDFDSFQENKDSVTEAVEQHQLGTIEESWSQNPIARSLRASQNDRVYFTTYAKLNGLSGLIGTEMVIQELRQFGFDGG